MTLMQFRQSLDTSDLVASLRQGVIGEGMTIPGLAGDVSLVYADYVASGRALEIVENYIRDAVLPYYANSHTEASFCGSYMTRLRSEARAEIARLTGADDDCSVIFTGSGATSGLNRLVGLFGIDAARHPVVFIGPYEHHSNILPWRESKATVVEIPESETGGVDLGALEEALVTYADADLKIGSFSAASNVTGIVTAPDDITRLLKKHDALSVWDYAGGAPYLTIDMSPAEDTCKDAVVLSPHKFPGGPGASGVLIVRGSAVSRTSPTAPGGGTVTYVSPWNHHFTANLAAREEAGTPNIIGDIRAALALIVKEEIGQDFITAREEEMNARAMAAWQDNPHLTLLGTEQKHRLPIFSFLVHKADGSHFHHQLFTRMLSDIYGIQSRGGCACAGPYGHQLLGIDNETSRRLYDEIMQGNELEKPGWVRLNFNYLLSDETVQYIIDSVNDLTARLDEYEGFYTVDTATARFTPKKLSA